MISVVLPCRNEEAAIGDCIREIQRHVKGSYEIIVSDSSSDRSAHIAQEMGARVVEHGEVGYGRAIQHGIAAAKGDVIVMADADMTYDFSDIPYMMQQLENGADLVIGNRFGKKRERGAMPVVHGLIGQPLFAGLLYLRCGSKVKDPHCGLRAFSKEVYDTMQLDEPGMEFASEMIVQAYKKKLSIHQFPTKYSLRVGDSKLHTFRDGCRHIRYLLIG